MEKTEFSERLAQLRLAKGVSAREMSLAIGQSANYINKIENKHAFPSMLVFFSICEYLGVSEQEFFDTGTDAYKRNYYSDRFSYAKEIAQAAYERNDLSEPNNAPIEATRGFGFIERYADGDFYIKEEQIIHCLEDPPRGRTSYAELKILCGRIRKIERIAEQIEMIGSIMNSTSPELSFLERSQLCRLLSRDPATKIAFAKWKRQSARKRSRV